MRIAGRLAIAAVVCAVGLLGQRDLGTILGTVTDPTGGVVAGARVTIIEDLTGSRVTVETDAAG